MARRQKLRVSLYSFSGSGIGWLRLVKKSLGDGRFAIKLFFLFSY
jgi:hypothetical protein